MAKDLDKVQPALAVFGLDQSKKAHGSYFGQDELDLAIKAAAEGGLFALRIVGDELTALASKLPRGKLFDSGGAFIPFARGQLVSSLMTAGEAAGDDFLRPTTLLADRPAKPKTKSAQGPAVASKSQPLPPGPHRVPQDWATLEVGCLVLAADDPADGYHPAIIVAIDEAKKGADREVVLQFRDYPDYAALRRAVRDLALLHRSAGEPAQQSA